MEEYLTVDELSTRIKFSKQSLYNLIHQGTFILGKHYLKPTPKKVLFKWTEIKSWMGDCNLESSDEKEYLLNNKERSRTDLKPQVHRCESKSSIII